MTFYGWFSEQRVTRLGAARRDRIDRFRLAQLSRHIAPPGDMLEIGPGQGSVAQAAIADGWRYRAIEASPILAERLRRRGLDVIEAWTPPMLAADASCDVVFADQVLEHMSGVEAAKHFVAEAHRTLRPRGILFVVVPDCMKERMFFWDIDYTHSFVTTERRVRQLLYDGGFGVEAVVRSIGAATGVLRDALGAGAVLVDFPGVNTLARYTKTEELLYRVRKNLFQTLAFVARKDDS
jgi:SAM-dependent methyltransferase